MVIPCIARLMSSPLPIRTATTATKAVMAATISIILIYKGSIKPVTPVTIALAALTGPCKSFTALLTVTITAAMPAMLITAVSTGVGMLVITSANACKIGSSAVAKLRFTASPCLFSFCRLSSNAPRLSSVSASIT